MMIGRVTRGILAAAVTAALVSGAPGPALAQHSREGTRPATGEKAKKHRRRPQKVIEMDVLEVVGKVQKPRVYYVIGRGQLKYESLPLERDLVKEVEESVDGPPF